jgi:hypothetical protein
MMQRWPRVIGICLFEQICYLLPVVDHWHIVLVCSIYKELFLFIFSSKERLHFLLLCFPSSWIIARKHQVLITQWLGKVGCGLFCFFLWWRCVIAWSSACSHFSGDVLVTREGPLWRTDGVIVIVDIVDGAVLAGIRGSTSGGWLWIGNEVNCSRGVIGSRHQGINVTWVICELVMEFTAAVEWLAARDFLTLDDGLSHWV